MMEQVGSPTTSFGHEGWMSPGNRTLGWARVLSPGDLRYQLGTMTGEWTPGSHPMANSLLAREPFPSRLFRDAKRVADLRPGSFASALEGTSARDSETSVPGFNLGQGLANADGHDERVGLESL